MRKICTLLIAVLVMLPLHLGAETIQKPVFFAAIQDMPIMQGLRELTDQTVTFDKPQGRIVEAVAQIDSLSEEAVRQYYAQTLPQLGWETLEEQKYVRGNEHLSLTFEQVEDERFLRITLTPK